MEDSILVGNVWFSKDRTLDTVVIRGILPNVCDSILEVNVELLSSVNSTFDTVICAGENLTIGNMIFDETNSSGSVTLFGANQYGCDSIISVLVGFHPIPMSVFDTSICKGGKLIIGNITFDELNTKGLVRLPGTNQYGCESLVLVQL